MNKCVRHFWIGVGLILIAGATLCQDALAQPATEGSAPKLPPELLSQLQKQADALRVFYFEYDVVLERLYLTNRDSDDKKQFSVYHEDNRFYSRWQRDSQKVLYDEAYDGTIFYYANIAETNSNPPAFVRKTRVSDHTDPDRWQFFAEESYLEGLGFFCPERMMEMEDFTSVQPLLLHYSKEKHLVKVEKDGDKFRVTALMPDRWVVAVRTMNLDAYKKDLLRRNRADWVNPRIARYERLQKMPMERSVTFVFDPRYAGAATEREEHNLAGQLIRRVNTEDWKFYERPGIWLPNRIITTDYTQPVDLYTFSNSPVQINTVQLKKAAFDRREVQYALDQKSDYQALGTYVTERSTPEALTNRDHQVTHVVGAFTGKPLRPLP